MNIFDLINIVSGSGIPEFKPVIVNNLPKVYTDKKALEFLHSLNKLQSGESGGLYNIFFNKQEIELPDECRGDTNLCDNLGGSVPALPVSRCDDPCYDIAGVECNDPPVVDVQNNKSFVYVIVEGRTTETFMEEIIGNESWEIPSCLALNRKNPQEQLYFPCQGDLLGQPPAYARVSYVKWNQKAIEDDNAFFSEKNAFLVLRCDGGIFWLADIKLALTDFTDPYNFKTVVYQWWNLKLDTHCGRPIGSIQKKMDCTPPDEIVIENYEEGEELPKPTFAVTFVHYNEKCEE
jgi:hypothetical protein